MSLLTKDKMTIPREDVDTTSVEKCKIIFVRYILLQGNWLLCMLKHTQIGFLHRI